MILIYGSRNFIGKRDTRGHHSRDYMWFECKQFGHSVQLQYSSILSSGQTWCTCEARCRTWADPCAWGPCPSSRVPACRCGNTWRTSAESSACAPRRARWSFGRMTCWWAPRCSCPASSWGNTRHRWCAGTGSSSRGESAPADRRIQNKNAELFFF